MQCIHRTIAAINDSAVQLISNEAILIAATCSSRYNSSSTVDAELTCRPARARISTRAIMNFSGLTWALNKRRGSRLVGWCYLGALPPDQPSFSPGVYRLTLPNTERLPV